MTDFNPFLLRVFYYNTTALDRYDFEFSAVLAATATLSLFAKDFGSNILRFCMLKAYVKRIWCILHQLNNCECKEDLKTAVNMPDLLDVTYYFSSKINLHLITEAFNNLGCYCYLTIKHDLVNLIYYTCGQIPLYHWWAFDTRFILNH